MNDNPTATKWIGMPVERLEDPPLAVSYTHLTLPTILRV